MDLLRTTARGGTGVMAILHDLTLAARFCDRLVLLHHGRVLAEGRPDFVLSAANLDTAYRVTAATGRFAGEPFIVPWQRLGPSELL
jgi:iron complex transport system ATP-binding protein